MKASKTFCPQCGIAYREAWTVCNRNACPMLDDAQASLAAPLPTPSVQLESEPVEAVRGEAGDGGGVES